MPICWLAAVARSLMIENRATPVLVIVGQTREGQRAIAQTLANRAAALGLAVFLIAVPLSLLAAGSLLRPIGLLAQLWGGAVATICARCATPRRPNCCRWSNS